MGKIKIIGNLFTLTFAGSEVYTTFAAANTGVAQLVEHRSPKPGVGSSSLSSRAKKLYQIDTTFLYRAKPQLSPFRNSLKYVPLPHIKRNLTVYEIDKAIIYCCWEIGI